MKPKQGGSVPELKPYSLTPEPKDFSEKQEELEKLEPSEEVIDANNCNSTGGKSIDISFLIVIFLIISKYIFKRFKLI